MLEITVVPQAVPGPRGPQSSGKGEWELIHALHKTDVKDLQNVFRLTDRHPVTVNLWLCPVHTPSVFRH